jgi:hypothetical protein
METVVGCLPAALFNDGVIRLIFSFEVWYVSVPRGKGILSIQPSHQPPNPVRQGTGSNAHLYALP